MRNKKNLLALALVAGWMGVAGAQVKLPAVIGDGMMLQQQSQVKLWGWCTPGGEVRVTPSWQGAETALATADAEGRWAVRMQTPVGGFDTYEICFAQGGEETRVTDVMVGEVWLASGQSNMEMPLEGFDGCCVKDGLDDAIAATDQRGVRFFVVPRRHAYSPLYNIDAHWQDTGDFSQVMKWSAVAYHFASNLSRALRMPVGIVECAYGGTRVESWLPREILDGYEDIETDTLKVAQQLPDYERQMAVYYGMFCAIKGYTVKGMIWYQGCSNVQSYQTYADRLTTMVGLWREEMESGEIPFYFVEIAPFQYGTGDEARSARLREAQHRTLETISNSGMVSTNDLVEPYELYNIHPRDKKTVGHRLSWLALHKTYGHTEVCCEGPQYKSWTAKGNEAWVAFDHLQKGICRNTALEGFEVAGEDHVFYPVDNAWLHWQTNEVVVSSEKVSAPVAVRYGFRDFLPGTLKGGNELPAVPFRTDDW